MKRLLVLIFVVVSLTGCRQTPVIPTNAPIAAITKPQNSLSTEQLKSLRVNEAGVVPILEYHAIGNGRTTMDRSPEKFRADLERLYQEGYRPCLLAEYLDNKIGVPSGTCPVIFTFDDSRESQLRLLPDGSVDPECAVGILQAFAKLHADFPVKATFYVLPQSPFGPAAQGAQKFKMIRDLGCEIGNHTISHPRLRSLSDEKVQAEIGGAEKLITALAPGVKVDTLALPFGIRPRNRPLASAGSFEGMPYHYRAVLLVGANPALAPVSKKCDYLRLPRIQACEGDAGITYWLDSLKSHPERRYVSDGDPNSTVVPAADRIKLDEARLNGSKILEY